MADFGAGDVVRGLVSLEQTSPHTMIANFRPNPETRKLLRLEEDETVEAKLLEFDAATNRLRIYPLKTQPRRDLFLQPKYSVVRVFDVPFDHLELPASSSDVTVLLEFLPRGFIKDFQFGLGLAKAYNPIVRAIELGTKCAEIRLIADGEFSVDGKVLDLPLEDLESLRAEADRIAGRGSTAVLNVKEASAHNWLATRLGQEEVPYKRGRHPMIQYFADVAASGERKLEEGDIEDLVEAIRDSPTLVAQQKPEILAKLRSDIELVELDTLLDRFEKMLMASNDEAVWQNFFTENPFILSFAFGYPLILVQDQAVAGGRKISGSGEKILDFLAKNPTTNNVAIIEIKKPATLLLQNKQYRKGVYAPSLELAGAVTQVLDQKYQLLGEFATLVRASRNYEIESFAVRLCLVVGKMPSDVDQVKSFELFRESLSGVDIVTFDELLERIRLLRSFLQG